MVRELAMDEQDRLIAEAVERDEPRLRSFIRRRVADIGDADDVLEEVFSELVEAYRMMKPAEEMTAWLFRVARNRITDLFRKRKAVSLNEPVNDEGGATLEDLLPSPTAGPDAEYARAVMLETLDDAIDERGCASRIGEDSWPVAECEIGGQNGAFLFVSAADDLKQEVGVAVVEFSSVFFDHVFDHRFAERLVVDCALDACLRTG